MKTVTANIKKETVFSNIPLLSKDVKEWLMPYTEGYKGEVLSRMEKAISETIPPVMGFNIHEVDLSISKEEMVDMRESFISTISTEMAQGGHLCGAGIYPIHINPEEGGQLCALMAIAPNATVAMIIRKGRLVHDSGLAN